MGEELLAQLVERSEVAVLAGLRAGEDHEAIVTPGPEVVGGREPDHSLGGLAGGIALPVLILEQRAGARREEHRERVVEPLGESDRLTDGGGSLLRYPRDHWARARWVPQQAPGSCPP